MWRGSCKFSHFEAVKFGVSTVILPLFAVIERDEGVEFFSLFVSFEVSGHQAQLFLFAAFKL